MHCRLIDRTADATKRYADTMLNLHIKLAETYVAPERAPRCRRAAHAALPDNAAPRNGSVRPLIDLIDKHVDPPADVKAFVDDLRLPDFTPPPELVRPGVRARPASEEHRHWSGLVRAGAWPIDRCSNRSHRR